MLGHTVPCNEALLHLISGLRSVRVHEEDDDWENEACLVMEVVNDE